MDNPVDDMEDSRPCFAEEICLNTEAFSRLQNKNRLTEMALGRYSCRHEQIPATADYVRKIDLSNFQVATNETARDINRRIVLNLIRRHQPLSRADISRRTGLQRSTVSAITEQLIAQRWVTEGAVGNAPRGRKPTFLHLNGQRAGIIGVNIRPLNTAIALAGLDMQFLSQESMPTGSDPNRFIAELSRRITEIVKVHPEMVFEGIGISVPGRVNLTSQKLVFAPNLGWAGIDLKTALEKATGLSVDLENAANVCALAELWSGRHGEGVRHLVAVTVSEGIGVGLILNGQLFQGPTGLAGEFGHITIRDDGPSCRCGNRGCWEVWASNTAAVRFYSSTASHCDLPSSAPRFEDLLRLSEQGDLKAGEALDKMAHYIGLGLAMLVTGLAPDVIVLFGEFTEAWARMKPAIQNVLNERQPTHASTVIMPTDPSTHPRLRGTIALVLQKHFGLPALA
jgi:predicted NBD/HSP70 family sugar kinase